MEQQWLNRQLPINYSKRCGVEEEHHRFGRYKYLVCFNFTLYACRQHANKTTGIIVRG